MKLLNFTFIKLTICLILGILLAHYANIDFEYIISTTIVLIVILGIYWVLLKFKIIRKPYFGILAYLATICIGAFAYISQNNTLKPNHYSHFYKQESKKKSIIFRVEERLKPDLYNTKYIVSIKSYNLQEASGRLLVNVSRDSLIEPLNIDEVFCTFVLLKEIQKPLNPHQFNYREYLEFRQVYHQLHIKDESLLKLANSKTTTYGFADRLRKNINAKLKKAGFKAGVLNIMNALFLGQRQDIDRSIYTNYVNSGAIHILAISGLHVGIILFILNLLFKPLRYFKYGNYIKPVSIILLLWFFAIIAGLSPSVTRAVTMFSIISIAMHLKRPTNVYNTLVISAFLILLFKPLFLFEVGFQLSYLAVFGIVSIQPKLYKLFDSKYWIFNKLWQIFTVTLAAQIGILPLSLFYYHQFPGLFFISNVVIIPFLGVILGFGLLIIILAIASILPKFLVVIYSIIIDSLNVFIAWVAQFENFLFRDIPFSFTQVVSSYIVIVAAIQTFKFKRFKWLAICLIGIIGFQSVLIYNDYNNKYSSFIIFNKNRHTLIGQKQNNKLLVHHNLDSLFLRKDKVIRNYKVGESIDEVLLDSLQPLYLFKGKTILVIDSMGIYKGLPFKQNYILLRNSPKINLNRIIDSLQPQQIIADASNYKLYVARWKITCANKKIPFHQTNKNGAFILK